MPNWEEIRLEWETSNKTYKELESQFNVKSATIRSRKNREKWQRNATGNATQQKKSVATKKAIKIDASELTEKQQRFVEEYMIDLNATQAAIRAGYSEKTAYSQGQRLLKNVEILARIKELREQQANETYMSSLWVLEKLGQIVEKSMQAEPVMEFDYGAQELVATGEYQYDSIGANKALELIGKHFMMFDPKARHIDEITKVQIEKMKADIDKVKAETKSEGTASTKTIILTNEDEMRRVIAERKAAKEDG